MYSHPGRRQVYATPLFFTVALPAPALRPYIARYWALRGSFARAERITLLPDGNVDLVLNLGEGVRSRNHGSTPGGGAFHLIGAMLRADDQTLLGEQHLVGVTFKPGGFPCFHRWDPMREAANRVQPFARGFPGQVGHDLARLAPRLDGFYLKRLVPPRSSLAEVLADIETSRGQVRMDVLMKRHATTGRTLERLFEQQVGITPKELIDLTRFKHALAVIERDRGSRSLMQIARACGYYDNAHLTNDFKRLTGHPPSRFVLSDLSKTAVT